MSSNSEIHNILFTVTSCLSNKVTNMSNFELQRKQIWVSCQGENPVDRENLGPVEMYPGMGFAGYYYPFRNQKDYLSPLVAVQFKRPEGIQFYIRMIHNIHSKYLHFLLDAIYVVDTIEEIAYHIFRIYYFRIDYIIFIMHKLIKYSIIHIRGRFLKFIIYL